MLPWYGDPKLLVSYLSEVKVCSECLGFAYSGHLPYALYNGGMVTSLGYDY